MRVIAVVPAYNESQAIGAVIKGLRQFVDAIVVVDDGSTDMTGAIAASAGAVVLRHFLNRGQGAALQTGIQYALDHGADFVVTFDADGQHQPVEVPKLVEPLLLGRYDVSLGSRFLKPRTSDVWRGIRCPAMCTSRPAMPVLRRWLLKLATIFDRLRTGLQITDTHNGLRAFSRLAAEQIIIRQDGMAHASEILDDISRLKLRYFEVSVSVRYTVYSKAKGQSVRNSLAILRDLVLRRNHL